MPLASTLLLLSALLALLGFAASIVTDIVALTQASRTLDHSMQIVEELLFFAPLAIHISAQYRWFVDWEAQDQPLLHPPRLSWSPYAVILLLLLSDLVYELQQLIDSGVAVLYNIGSWIAFAFEVLISILMVLVLKLAHSNGIKMRMY